MPGRYKPYPEYKDSGVEWLGSIPAKWKVIPLKFMTANMVKDGPHETPEFIDEGIPFFSVDSIQNNKLIFEGCRYISIEEHKRFSLKCLPQKGDVLLGKAASVGKVAYVDTSREFNVWSPLAVITPKSDRLGKFIFYGLQSAWLKAQCEVSSNSNTQKNLSMQAIDNLTFAIPFNADAERIASFLDHETGKIDALIEKQQQLIKLLQEKRQAVISHAVTKGLNPAAPMKDSGIDWLGQVPANWKVSFLKRFTKSIRDGTHNPPVAEDGIYRLLSVRNIIDGELQLRDDDRTMSLKSFEELQRSYTVEPGDVVLAIVGGTTGKSAVVGKLNNVTVQRSLAIIRSVVSQLNPWFLNYVLQSEYIQNTIKQIADKYSAQPGIYLDDTGNLKIPVPSLEEQRQICDFLDEKMNRLQFTLKKCDLQISLLNERRKSLISAAVTGKIDVRDWVSPTETKKDI